MRACAVRHYVIVMYIYFISMYAARLIGRCLHPFWYHYIGVVGRMASKPVLLPEPYSGESGSWVDRIDHFECIAEVNK